MRTEDLIFHAHQNLLHSAWIVLNGTWTCRSMNVLVREYIQYYEYLLVLLTNIVGLQTTLEHQRLNTGSAAIKRVLKEQNNSCILRNAPNVWPDSLQKTEQDLVMAPNRDVLLNTSLEAIQSRLREAIEKEDKGLVVCENSYTLNCGHYDRFADFKCVNDYMHFGSPDHEDWILVVFNRKISKSHHHGGGGYGPFCGYVVCLVFERWCLSFRDMCSSVKREN